MQIISLLVNKISSNGSIESKFYEVVEDAVEASKKSQLSNTSKNEEEANDSNHLSPAKIDGKEQEEMTSQVSNPYAIKIVENNDSQEFLNHKSRNSSFKSTDEDKIFK